MNFDQINNSKKKLEKDDEIRFNPNLFEIRQKITYLSIKINSRSKLQYFIPLKLYMK